MSQMPLEQCYQWLDLSPGADLATVEAAYAKKMMALLRQGGGADKSLLKTAYHQLKDHVMQQAAEVAQTKIAAKTPQHQINQALGRRLSGQNMRHRVMVEGTEVQVHLQADRVPSQKWAMLVYTNIKDLHLSDIQTVRVYGLRGERAIVWKQQFSLAAADTTRDDRDPFSFNNRYVTAAAFPAAMVLAILFHVIAIFNIVFGPFHIWIHEFGHATVAWLAGHRATPLPIGFTPVGEERSLIVYLCFLALLSLLFWAGWREQKRGTMAIAGILAIIQFYMTWFMSPDTYEMLLYFGGVGGEFYLSTLLMVCFYFPLPEKWRWDFWRYIVILIAAHTFVDIFWTWHQIKQGTGSIPWGTLFGGSEDAGGDMNQLSAVYGWSDRQIMQTYTQLGNLCLLVLIGVYIFFLIKQNRQVFNQH
jgi:hypothetical protein